jgi:xanthine dehydrogenase iron-sulfur cluster and FAD-binding subunit A
MWRDYINAAELSEVLTLLDSRKEKARLVAGATDLLLEMERGVRQNIETLVDVSRIPGMDQITLDDQGWIHLGPMVTHNHVVSSSLLHDQALPLVQAAWQVGSPQIRNRGTIVGNLVTASPANDTITPLMAMNAELTLQSINGQRRVTLSDFYTGVRKTILQANEMITDICFRALQTNHIGSFLKVALRQAQAISVVNAAVIFEIENDRILSAHITLGAVAPTIIHAPMAEQFLKEKLIDRDVFKKAALIASQESRPINDLRGSALYRTEMVRVACHRAFEQAAGLRAGITVPKDPVLLWGKNQASTPVTGSKFDSRQPIKTSINGQSYTFNTGHHKTLLHLLRDEGLLTGSKEGCGEGECGACTIYLDGKAVMGCLVPAPRAHQAKIVTIEGLARGNQLHPLQQSFIDAGAVQCGFCTPGLIMSGAKLLEEKPRPRQTEIRQAITGNLCRCTGYYKIIQAIENTADMEVQNG